MAGDMRDTLNPSSSPTSTPPAQSSLFAQLYEYIEPIERRLIVLTDQIRQCVEPINKRLIEQLCEFAEPFHKTRIVYGWHGACDSTNLYFSLCGLYYAFLDAYHHAHNILDPQDFQISNKEFHDAENTPEGLAYTVAFGLVLVSFATIGSFSDTDNKYFVLRWMASLWPYIRDALKIIKWTFKGLRSALAVFIQLGANKDSLIPLLFPLAAVLAVTAVINRIWLRRMRDARKEMMRVNLQLHDKIIEDRQVIHQLTEEPKSYERYKSTLVVVTTKGQRKIHYVNANGEPISFSDDQALAFSNKFSALQVEYLHDIMSQYLSYLKPAEQHIALHFYASNDMPTEFPDHLRNSYVYLTANSQLKLCYVQNDGSVLIDDEMSTSFRQRYLAVLDSNDILCMPAEPLKRILSGINLGDVELKDVQRKLSGYADCVLVKMPNIPDQFEDIEGSHDTNVLILCDKDFYFADRNTRSYNKVALNISNGKGEAIENLKAIFTDAPQRANAETLALMKDIKGSILKWFIADQEEWEQNIGFFAAAYSGFCDSLYFYMGTMVIAVFAPQVYATLLLFSVALMVICIITRLHEENEYQRKHRLTCIKPQLELSKSASILLYEKFEASLATGSEMGSFQQDWNALTQKINECKKLRTALKEQLSGSFSMAIGTGLLNGLALQGSIACVMFTMTAFGLISLAWTPTFVLVCMSLGIVAIIVSCAYAVTQYLGYKKKLNKSESEFDEDFDSKYQSIKEEFNDTSQTTDLAQMREILTYINSRAFDPPPEYMVLEWCEIFRLFFSGLVKGDKAWVELFYGFLKKFDGSPIMPVIAICSMVGFALAFGSALALRYVSKTLIVSNSNEVSPQSKNVWATAVNYPPSFFPSHLSPATAGSTNDLQAQDSSEYALAV